ncbi:single-stranded DNA-binding protein [Microbacterium trichothecenolyticum]|uniref:Single-stranded DNA-binding protein n=1 Tax=Microbacterium trichothecenolyticum TaxID=69370 RepID=A0ABU0TQQ1_MICTR|nr:single-stranded DNA-binding protein [Microbacterium trichothecenolyticum]MDQ1121993.1 single-strand DNA-binding protein [Microbacterium trichothecenolyticum]
MSDHITIVGNIVGDLEQRSTRGGGPVAAFRLAVGERRLDRERGEWVDGHTNFYAVSVFGELGANALRSFRKGERVIVSGRLRLREWEAENRRGVSADVTADAVGHDVRWGITRFVRIPRPEEAEATARDESGTAAHPPAARDADGWAVPGASGAAGGAERVPEAGDAPAPGEPVETPF